MDNNTRTTRRDDTTDVRNTAIFPVVIQAELLDKSHGANTLNHKKRNAPEIQLIKLFLPFINACPGKVNLRFYGMVNPISHFKEIPSLALKNGKSRIFTDLTGSIINCND